MNTPRLALFLSILALLGLGTPGARATEPAYKAEFGGVEIALGKGWERLDQPINLFVQHRAKHATRGTAMSAGSLTVGLTLDQYVALGAAGMASGPEAALAILSKASGISKEDLEKALGSRIGQQMMEGVKQAAKGVRFELIHVGKKMVEGAAQYEVHSKMEIAATGMTVFSRQFALAGAAPNEIVQITFADASEEVFKRKDLAASFRTKFKGSSQEPGKSL